MLVKTNTLLSAAVALTLTACGGSSSDSTSSGRAVDGYLSGSEVVCVETNVKATTGPTGIYTFSPACSSAVVVTKGKNIDTGFDFKGRLKAPAGAVVVTPLTTLMADMTPAQVASLLAFLGLPPETDVTKLDPADGQHFALSKATQAMHHIMHQMANVSGHLLAETDTASLYGKIAIAISQELSAPGVLPLFKADGSVNTGLLRSIVTRAALAAGLTVQISADELADLADEIAEQASDYLEAASPGTLKNIAKDHQDPETAPIDTSSTKFLALQDDTISVNGTLTTPGTAITLANFASGVTISNLSTIGLKFDVSHIPVVDTKVGIFLELTERAGGEDRKLQIMIDRVKMKFTDGQISIEPASDAKVFVFGHTGSGTDINLTLSDLAFKPITVLNNKINLNFDVIVQKVLASTELKTTAEKFTNITGTFDTKLVVSDLNIRHADGSKFDLFSVAVTGSSESTAMSGRGITGKLTIHP